MKVPRSPGKRPLRVLLFANDGLGAGHVARALAIARALRRRAPGAGVEIELLLATTSEADRLIAGLGLACVRWPAPRTARESGWSDTERRHVAEHVLRGAIEGFRPDLLVTDTFPEGPHGELAGLLREVPRRALVRRSVRPDRAGDMVLAAGLMHYDLAIVPDDPIEPAGEALPIPDVRVPPITLFEAGEALGRGEARARLGLPSEGRFVLVCAGGGGDPEGMAAAARASEAISRIPGGPTPVLAEGPLFCGTRAAHHRTVAEAPLQPLLSAFDGAIAAAGYNLSHELAKAGVPVALFSQPRPFDDQAARAARFARAGLAQALAEIDEASVAEAVAWMPRAPRPSLEAGGADRAADALLRLAVRGAP